MSGPYSGERAGPRTQAAVQSVPCDRQSRVSWAHHPTAWISQHLIVSRNTVPLRQYGEPGGKQRCSRALARKRGVDALGIIGPGLPGLCCSQGLGCGTKGSSLAPRADPLVPLLQGITNEENETSQVNLVSKAGLGWDGRAWDDPCQETGREQHLIPSTLHYIYKRSDVKGEERKKFRHQRFFLGSVVASA
jgi:hypothetical protein